MTAVELVQAAIDKLNKLKSDGTPAPYWFHNVGNVVEAVLAEDSEIVAVLRLTIDAQIATLDRWLEYRPLQMEEPVVALADAILGGAE